MTKRGRTREMLMCLSGITRRDTSSRVIDAKVKLNYGVSSVCLKTCVTLCVLERGDFQAQALFVCRRLVALDQRFRSSPRPTTPTGFTLMSFRGHRDIDVHIHHPFISQRWNIRSVKVQQRACTCTSYPLHPIISRNATSCFRL